MENQIHCPHCGSKKLQSRGRQFQCNNCHKYFEKRKQPRKLEESIVEEQDRREQTFTTSTHITSLKELVSQCEIDLDVWEIER